MRISAPADKRFRRAQANPIRRRRSWAGHGWPVARAALLLAIAMYGTYRGAALALSADALTVTRFTVSGNVRLSRGEVLSLVDGLRGRSMLTVDLDTWRRRLKGSPWVADVAMRRVLPGTVDIVIAERQPMGLGRLGGELYLVDQRGAIIDQFGPNYAELDLPIIDGLSAAGPRDGTTLVDEERAALAARLLASLQPRPDLARRMSQVDVSDRRDAVVILEHDTALVRLGDDQFVDRLQSYLDLAPALRERVDGIDYVDLRFDERVYVKPHRASRRGRGGAVQRRGGGD